METEFEERTSPYRRELFAHCYRMLGSVHDAEDLLQDTLIRAWRSFDAYDEHRASLRTWLYRIATNACLTALAGRARRPLPSGLGNATYDPLDAFAPGFEVPWVQPVPADPAEEVAARGRLRLALVAALQMLPPRQRAVLILRDVLDWPAADVAAMLDSTVASVNSALQRARARLAELEVREDDIREPAAARDMVDRYVAAFEAADLTALRRLLTADVVMEMPPFLNWFRGPDDYVRFIARAYALRGTDWRMLPVDANGQPAVIAYVRTGGVYTIHTLQLFEPTPAGIAHTTVFQDPTVFALFALPETLPAPDH